MQVLALYGDNVNISEAVFISIFSMMVVFIVLLIISYMIDLVALFINKGLKRNKVENKVIPAENITSDIVKSDVTVAAIAAAIASYIGTDVQNIVIRKIRRIDKRTRRI